MIHILPSKMDYQTFLESKRFKTKDFGIDIDVNQIRPMLFPFQRDIVRWAVKKGRCAIFADTGLGKTLMQIEWARQINKKTLIVAPLSVTRQTIKEGKKLGCDIKYIRDQSESYQFSITNYDMIDNLNFDQFNSIILDESSILKSISGKTKRKLILLCSKIPFKLCCTATPAPNDWVELGNHSEFLGICKRDEMLAMFFINANKDHYIEMDKKIFRRKGSNKGGTEWRLKHHAEKPFFRWLASWAMTLRKPSDLGYDDTGFDLPPLSVSPHFVNSDYKPNDMLFFTKIRGIKEAAKIRADTIDNKIVKLKEIISNTNGNQIIVWAGLDAEGMAISKALNAIEVKGNDSIEYKIKSFEDFQDNIFPILVTKPKIGGFGMNFQNSNVAIFFGLNYSWETYYQCIRRQWRYKQKQPVYVHIILAHHEKGIYDNIKRKDAAEAKLKEKLMDEIRDYEKKEISNPNNFNRIKYQNKIEKGNRWALVLGDACEELKTVFNDSIHLSIYSPPFADLFTYTDSERDLGNCKDWNEFFKHYAFIIPEILRVTMPGRLTCVHVSDIPALAQKDGFIGVKDFPGKVIDAYIDKGWIFIGRIFIQKNPQAQAIRTKAKSLLFVQLNKDSSHSRPALIDQILLFKKPGDNKMPVIPVKNREMDNEKWIHWANGIWTDIQETKTLQYTNARDLDDEKHICPLQLETIERCIKLWSNPGELILSPFAGIGSEGYIALKFGRKFYGIELKESYFNIAVQNLKQAETETLPLFGGMKS